MNTHAQAQAQADTIDVFGFWIYIMSDCVLFAALFATYAVLHNNTYGGASVKDFVNLPYVFSQTMALLASSFTYGMSILALYGKKKSQVTAWLCITFLLGLSFIFLEVNEFIHLYLEGHAWNTSAALSAFFVLVGTHGFHVSIGLLWILIATIQLSLYGITPAMKRRLTYLGLFWAFLDIVWIFVFTIVYLMGAI